jgi:outer membrane protein assembly factor BamB
MKRVVALLLGASLLAGAFPSYSSAQNFDWPQWRGPNRDDVSKETGLLKQWPAEGPKKVWMSDVGGLGYAGFSVVKGKLFTMGARDQTEFLIALDANTGKELWATPIGGRLANKWGDGPRGTPTVDGDRVYTLGGDGTLICANVADGKSLWKVTMASLGGKVPNWGYTESVLVDGNKVLCTPGGPQGTVAALDKNSGKVIWQSAEWTEGAQYSSIIIADHNGKRQYIQLVMNTLAGLDAATGKVLWRSPWAGRTAVIPTPIFKNGHVYITTGYGVGSKLVKVAAGNMVSDVYENKVMKNHHGGVILIGDHLYGYSDGPGWICQNFMTGEEVWANKSLGKGAIAYADGMFYCLDEGSGAVALVEASPKGWNEKGRFKLEPQTTQRSPSGRIWTHPVISNGKLYLRDQELIFCFNVKK